MNCDAIDVGLGYVVVTSGAWRCWEFRRTLGGEYVSVRRLSADDYQYVLNRVALETAWPGRLVWRAGRTHPEFEPTPLAALPPEPWTAPGVGRP